MKKCLSSLPFIMVVMFNFLLPVIAHSQVTAKIAPDRDNTIYSFYPENSNGYGEDLLTGRQGQGNFLRALMHFDLSFIPAGNIINSAKLTLTVVRAKDNSGVLLHKLTKNWGEGNSGTSDDGTPQQGYAAATGDATWKHAFFPNTFWANPGGDYEQAASAFVPSFGNGTNIFPNVKADVQSWVNDSATNFGWILKGPDDNPGRSAKILHSRNAVNEHVRPVLEITYYDKNVASPPKVNILSPIDNDTYLSGKNIFISTDASDPDGTISKVEFYNGSTLLYRDSIAPFNFNWQNIPAGHFSVTAIAMDNSGLVTSSRPVHFSVLPRNVQDGQADSAFGLNGIVTTAGTFPFAGENYSAIKVQNDGKIVVAGTHVLARYNTDGSLDSTFSADGVQNTTVEPGYNSITTLAIQSNGKIIVGGTSLARYNTDGSLDSNFGVKGVKTTDMVITSLSIQSDQKILITGIKDIDRFIYEDFYIYRFNPDGTFDRTFSNDGKQDINFGGTIEIARSVAFQNDGKIIIVGTTNVRNSISDLAIARYNNNGSPDLSFSDDGKMITRFQSWSRSMGPAVALQGDGKIVVVGSTRKADEGDDSNKVAIVRITNNGKPDTSFSEDGIQTTRFKAAWAYGNSVAIQNDGKIIAGGIAVNLTSQNLFANDFGIARINKDGSFDNTFDSDGLQTTDIDQEDELAGIVISQDKLYSAGSASTCCDNTRTGVITRYLLNDKMESPPLVAITSPADSAAYLAPVRNLVLSATATDADGKISKVAFYNGTTLLSTVSDSPYTFTWHNVPKGNYLLQARATDNSGFNTTSVPVIVMVVANKPPVVNITSPANNAVFLKGSTVHLQAEAKDTDGRIGKVQFFNGATLLAKEEKYPYTADFRVIKEGTYTITATATDNWGAVSTSSPLTFSVVPNKAPAISIIYPPDGATFTTNDTINIQASAVDEDGRIANVMFYKGGILLTTEYKFPYTYQYKNIPAGTYTLSAVAKDNWADQTVSAPVTIVVIPYGTVSTERRSSSINNMQETRAAAKFSILPNPAHNFVNISTSGLQANKPLIMQIISPAGTILKTIRSTSSPTTAQIDISTLPAGVYIIKLVAGESILYKQLFKF